MSKRYGLLIVEGPHDQAFVARVLCCLGFQRFDGKQAGLDRVWEPWKPTYPKNGQLYAPLDMPKILVNQDWSIGVMVAGGGELWSRQKGFALRLRNNGSFMASIKNNGAIGFVLDADNEAPKRLVEKLQEVYLGIFADMPAAPGRVEPGPPRIGCFVIPNNTDIGTVESVLLPLGQTQYGKLLAHADAFVGACEPDLTTHFKPFDHLKARVAAAASILQPGSTNTITIERDDWVTERLLQHERLVPFVRFVCELFELSSPLTHAS